MSCAEDCGALPIQVRMLLGQVGQIDTCIRGGNEADVGGVERQDAGVLSSPHVLLRGFIKLQAESDGRAGRSCRQQVLHGVKRSVSLR